MNENRIAILWIGFIVMAMFVSGFCIVVGCHNFILPDPTPQPQTIDVSSHTDITDLYHEGYMQPSNTYVVHVSKNGVLFITNSSV